MTGRIEGHFKLAGHQTHNKTVDAIGRLLLPLDRLWAHYPRDRVKRNPFPTQPASPANPRAALKARCSSVRLPALKTLDQPSSCV